MERDASIPELQDLIRPWFDPAEFTPHFVDTPVRRADGNYESVLKRSDDENSFSMPQLTLDE